MTGRDPMNENHAPAHGAPVDHPQSSPHPSPTRRPGVVRLLLGHVPTVLVFAGLIALAWWGHHTGWQIPKFSEVAGASETEGGEKEDWCTEHSVPDSQCIACHPELAGGNPADWCKEHAVPESKCSVCHPEILTKGVAGDWCREHGVPESGCTICHEEIAARGEAPASDVGATVLPAEGEDANAPTTAPSPGAGTARAEPDLTTARPLADARAGKDPKTCQTHARRVQFATPESIQKAGVKLAAVVEKPIAATLDAPAETDFDRTRFAEISSPVAGRAWRVEQEVGARVKKGDVLALVDSAEVGKAKAQLLSAGAALELKAKTIKRIRASAEKGFRTDAELQEADAAVKEAKIHLFNAQQALANLGLTGGATAADLGTSPEPQAVRLLGLPESVTKTLDAKLTTANLLPITAPFDGVVVERKIVAGETVDPTKPLFAIADTSRLWVTMDLAVDNVSRVKVGQEVVFRADVARDQQVRGKVTWVSSAVDDETRTFRVRADVENEGRQLLARTFGAAQVLIRENPNAIAIPNDAIQWEGCCYVAFVRLSDTIFQTRKLRIGAEFNGYTEVLVGVLPGEVVATVGSNVLKSEILKANLGAGCTDD